MGTLYKGTTGNTKIEGHVSGAWIKWEQENGNGDDFKLIKTGHQTIPLKQGGCSHSIQIEATHFNLFGSVETMTRRELFR
jgi:hypothetical protein